MPHSAAKVSQPAFSTNGALAVLPRRRHKSTTHHLRNKRSEMRRLRWRGEVQTASSRFRTSFWQWREYHLRLLPQSARVLTAALSGQMDNAGVYAAVSRVFYGYCFLILSRQKRARTGRVRSEMPGSSSTRVLPQSCSAKAVTNEVSVRGNSKERNLTYLQSGQPWWRC